MGAEVGATTSTFPYTPNMRAYLHATGRAPVAHAADKAAANGFLAADEGAEYDEVIDIVIPLLPLELYARVWLTTCKDLSKVEPTINGPFTPDLATPLSKFASFVKENGWSDELSAGLIGSCTNSSYEDMVIRSEPAHPNDVDNPTDTRRRLGAAGEGCWAEDAGIDMTITLRLRDADLFLGPLPLHSWL